MPRIAGALCLLIAPILTACSAAHTETHVAGEALPLCPQLHRSENVLVLWGTAWRPDQKEAADRTKVAGVAIDQFFGRGACWRTATVRTSLDARDPLTLSDAEILGANEVTSGHYDRVITLRIEELGPTLALYLSPILWTNSTHVSLRVRVLTPDTGRLSSDVSIDWEKGGAFTIRGTSYLPDGLESALSAVFLGSATGD